MFLSAARYIPLILLGLAANALAAEKPVISLTMRYADARVRMFQTGFRPFQVISPDSDLFGRNFASREDIGRQFPEAAKCEPKNGAPCYFLFARGSDEIVAITTMGAHPDSLLVRKVSVVPLQDADSLYEH